MRTSRVYTAAVAHYFGNFLEMDWVHKVTISGITKAWSTVQLVFDNGPQLYSVEFATFVKTRVFKYDTSSPHYIPTVQHQGGVYCQNDQTFVQELSAKHLVSLSTSHYSISATHP